MSLQLRYVRVMQHTIPSTPVKSPKFTISKERMLTLLLVEHLRITGNYVANYVKHTSALLVYNKTV
jgi:hypothetical protein